MTRLMDLGGVIIAEISILFVILLITL